MGSGKSKLFAPSNIHNSRRPPITSQRPVDRGSLEQKTKHPPLHSPTLPRDPPKNTARSCRPFMCQHLRLILVLVVGDTSRNVTIEALPSNVLIKIFDCYRLDTLMHSHPGERPWKWQNLAHVCKKWQNLLFSQWHNFGMQLFFTVGMPVTDILNSWPILPIVMQYVDAPGSSPLSPSEQDNIMTLLELPTRLREIQLTVTTPLLEKVTTLTGMEQSFSVLEYLHLSATLPGLVLPSKFGSGMSRLRALRMVGIALPALPQLLLLAHDLVSLHLEKLPSIGYTLEALTICLPDLILLKSLRIHFLSPTHRPVLIVSADRPLLGFSVLPVLNFIEFHGTSEYLESLLSGISAPLLEHFQIDFFNQLIFDTPQLSRFLQTRHIDMQRSPTHATIQSSVADISITVTQPQRGVLHRFSLRISCTQLDWQIPSIAEVCDRLSPVLADVEELKIGVSASFPDVQDDLDLIHLHILELFRPFRNVKRLCVSGASLSLVAGALGLVPGELAVETLPELLVQKIRAKENNELAPARIVVGPLIVARQCTTHPIFVRSTRSRHARFNEDPVTDVRSFSSPASSSSSLAPSPGPSTPPPLPDGAFSSPTHSPSHAPISSFPSPPHPRVNTPLPIPQAHWYIPPAPLTPYVYLNTVLTVPNLQYDTRYHPSQSRLRSSPAVLAGPASNPPLKSLTIRVAGLPWECTVGPSPSMSRWNAVATVQDVLVGIYFHLRRKAKADEYHPLSRARKSEVFQTYERRVGDDPVQRGKGLLRVDFLCGHIIAQGLVRAQSKDDVWDVVVR